MLRLARALARRGRLREAVAVLHDALRLGVDFSDGELTGFSLLTELEQTFERLANRRRFPGARGLWSWETESGEARVELRGPQLEWSSAPKHGQQQRAGTFLLQGPPFDNVPREVALDVARRLGFDPPLWAHRYAPPPRRAVAEPRDAWRQDMIDRGLDPPVADEVVARDLQRQPRRHPCVEGFASPHEHDFLEQVENLEPQSVGWSDLVYRCTRCGRRWRIITDHGYHFPTHQITEQPPQ